MPLKAMIIDDESFARDDLRYMLSEHPDVEIVWEAGKFDEAKKLLAENRPDVIFMDVQLRGGTGFDLLSEIQSIASRVIFVTAHDRYASRAKRSGAIDCLHKPVSASRLDDALTQLRQRIKVRHAK
jgi:two-component system LytT family response regulator